MKKRGFTIIELLIVVAIIGILVGIGGVSIKRQAESRAMLRIKNEIGDFFRVAAKRSWETGKRYDINFNLVEKIITISRNGNLIEKLDLPNIFEYTIKDSGSYGSEFTSGFTSTGNISSDNFTFYVAKSNSNIGIQEDEEVIYAITFYKGDNHVNYLHVKEYIATSPFKISDINNSPSGNNKLKLIRD